MWNTYLLRAQFNTSQHTERNSRTKICTFHGSPNTMHHIVVRAYKWKFRRCNSLLHCGRSRTSKLLLLLRKIWCRVETTVRSVRVPIYTDIFRRWNSYALSLFAGAFPFPEKNRENGKYECVVLPRIIWILKQILIIREYNKFGIA